MVFILILLLFLVLVFCLGGYLLAKGIDCKFKDDYILFQDIDVEDFEENKKQKDIDK